MTKKSIGYPLPSGDAYTDEHACMMLFYPDKPEYRRALFGALDYFGTWLAWEKETEHKGKDAALAWKEAVQVTRECIEMNVCELMLGLLGEIRDNTAIHCCDVVDISDGDQYTDEVEDGVGNVPQNIIDAGYADDAADWAGFADYKCMIAHVMVDNMTAQLEQILGYMVAPSVILGGLPTLMAVASTIFIDALSVLVYAIALGASVSFKLHTALAFLGKSGLEDLIDDMATHHDALACAIYQADGSDDAIVQLRAVVESLFAETRSDVLNNLNIDAQLKALYSGRYDQQDIAEILADNGYDQEVYFCNMCGVDPLDVGANLEMVEVISVNAYGGSGEEHWTIHDVDETYGNGVEVDVEHLSASGHYFYIELTLAPSAHHADSDATFRGITYLIISTATGNEFDHYADAGGHVQVGYPAGHGRRTSWFGLHSDPYPAFQADCEDILENTYYNYVTTTGLSQLPDQARTLLLRFQVNGAQRYFLRVHTLHWAIDYQP